MLPHEKPITAHKFGEWVTPDGEDDSTLSDQLLDETKDETKDETPPPPPVVFDFVQCIEQRRQERETEKNVTLTRAFSLGKILRVHTLRDRLIEFEGLLPASTSSPTLLPTIVPCLYSDLRHHVRLSFDRTFLATAIAMENPPRSFQRLCHVFLVLLNEPRTSMLYRNWNEVRSLLKLNQKRKNRLVDLALSPYASVSYRQVEWCEEHLPNFIEGCDNERKTAIYKAKQTIHTFCTAILRCKQLIMGERPPPKLPKIKIKRTKRKKPKLVMVGAERNHIQTNTFQWKGNKSTTALLSTIPPWAVRGILRLRKMTLVVVRAKTGVIRKAMSRVFKTSSSAVKSVKKRVKMCAVKMASGANSGIDVHFAVEIIKPEAKATTALVSYIKAPEFLGQLVNKIREQNFYLSRSNMDCIDVVHSRIHKIRLRLQWGFPKTSSRYDCDFLDGSALLYNKEQLLDIIDFRGSHSELRRRRALLRGEESSSSSEESSSSSEDDDDDEEEEGDEEAGERKGHDDEDEADDDDDSSNDENDELDNMIQQRKNIKSHHWSSCDVHFPKDVVKHSGDVMNFAAKQGRHEIDLDLDLLPDRVTDVALTLSAYNSGDLSMFVQPEIRLFDLDNPMHELTPRYTVHQTKNEAAIMCTLRKRNELSNASWSIFADRTTGVGTVRDYRPIRKLLEGTIQRHDRWARRGWLLMLRKKGWIQTAKIHVISSDLWLRLLDQLCCSSAIPDELFHRILLFI